MFPELPENIFVVLRRESDMEPYTIAAELDRADEPESLFKAAWRLAAARPGGENIIARRTGETIRFWRGDDMDGWIDYVPPPSREPLIIKPGLAPIDPIALTALGGFAANPALVELQPKDAAARAREWAAAFREDQSS
jgi:hypothetical protein